MTSTALTSPATELRLGKSWLLLLALQVPLMVLVFWPFLSGQMYFAYTDIGSDTLTFYTPIAQHMARTLAHEGFGGWSFGIGLGSATALWLADGFMWLNTLGGPDVVLSLRIWVYLLKLMLGGAAMLLLLRQWFSAWPVSVLGALAYSFCGYAVVNGQWDSEASILVTLPLLMWAMVRTLRSGGWLALPLVVALALVCGAFFVSLAVFVVLAGLAFVVLSDSPKTTLWLGLTRVAPQVALGFVLAAPALLPMLMQYLDGARVSGGQGLIGKLLSQGLSVSDASLIQVQLASVLHKDLYGIGSAYKGFWNYLEGPGFYIGVLPLLLIAQLARGSAFERKALWLGLTAVAAYIVLPVFRLAAVGFGAPYFRVSTLWVTLVLLLLALLALQRVWRDGVDTRMLWVGVGVLALLLMVAKAGELGERLWTPHLWKIAVLTLLSVAVLMLARYQVLHPRAFAATLLGLVMLDVGWVGRSSYLEGRQIVTPATNRFLDGTQQALQAIRAQDTGVYRIEKSYRSVGLADALAQDYRGVASYSFHSKAAADFQVLMNLIPPPEQAPAVNYTNWLPDPGARFMLHSLLGVKYLISRGPLNGPGMTLLNHTSGDLFLYRNEQALPLGFVQSRQITRAQFDTLNRFDPERSQILKDIVSFNTVVLDEPLPGFGSPFDLDRLLNSRELTLRSHYVEPAQSLQAQGLKISQFSNTSIRGQINTAEDGILVLSMPFNAGWQVLLDGQPAQPIRAYAGLMALPLKAGAHEVALDFQLPGLRLGLMLGALGWCTWLVLAWRQRAISSPSAEAK